MSTVTIDAIEKVRDTFNFTVDKFPLSGPDGMKTPFYGLFRSDNCQSVGTAVRVITLSACFRSSCHPLSGHPSAMV